MHFSSFLKLSPKRESEILVIYHSRIRILGTVAKGGSQGTGTAFVVMRILAVINRTVDANGPHARCISVAIAIVLFPAVPRSPNIDIAQSVSALITMHKGKIKSF